MTGFFRKLLWVTQRDRKEAELREELQFHIEEEANQRQAEGLRDDEALSAARREFQHGAYWSVALTRTSRWCSMAPVL